MTHRTLCPASVLFATAALLGPVLALPSPAAARPDRTVTVVIAADEEFRNDPDWETQARQALAVAGSVFKNDLGIRFAVRRVVGWTSRSSDYDLSALHDEMAAAVDAGDADIVIGFTGGPEFTEQRHLVKLGHSDTPGPRLVVTGRAGDDLAIVLRHELGHAFGVPHVRSVPSIMNEDVRSDRSRFDPMSAAIIENNVDIDFRSQDPFAGCRLDRLEALYLEMAEAGNLSADLLALVGDSHRRRGDKGEAERVYRRALELDSNLMGARLGLGMLAMAGSRYPEAVRLYEDARRDDPNIPGIDMNLGIAYTELGQAKSAQAAYVRAIEADPKDAAAMNNLALLYLEDGRMEEAEALFKRAIEARPRFMEALNNLGMLYQRWNRPDAAIQTFRSALRVSETALTHRNLASVLLTSGRRAEAKKHIEASLRMDPAQPDADELKALSLELQ